MLTSPPSGLRQPTKALKTAFWLELGVLNWFVLAGKNVRMYKLTSGESKKYIVYIKKFTERIIYEMIREGKSQNKLFFTIIERYFIFNYTCKIF